MTIKNLDPEYKRATKRLNFFFTEEHEDIRSLSPSELLWYLATVLLWLEVREETKLPGIPLVSDGKE